MKVEEELDEHVNQEFLEDPLKIVIPSIHIKQDTELKQDLDGPEHDFLGDHLGISRPSDFIKEDPELNLDVDGTENTVAASIRNASDNVSFIHSAGETCDISSQETLNEGVVDNELEIDAEKSIDFTMFGS
ncbi:uncharacterized protein LOC126295193 [Schistocerca gregaria]|uniref:uncharacterized protein LOC126295193 n=1 Tax=Schistocerca gregaria TaxID=7010 RepID=UPI00211EB0DD|nr:uncharacterized protein LOC126295193 [Schistocerca gregaria]